LFCAAAARVARSVCRAFGGGGGRRREVVGRLRTGFFADRERSGMAPGGCLHGWAWRSKIIYDKGLCHWSVCAAGGDRASFWSQRTRLAKKTGESRDGEAGRSAGQDQGDGSWRWVRRASEGERRPWAWLRRRDGVDGICASGWREFHGNVG